ncbi:MAG: hypothetical protein HZA17_07735 [Nitrospirae bacterium]|nr:hypothetical protein [Nitrospirota bacterium]
MILNCWEFKKCGSESKKGLGICPAFTETKAHRLNRGKNGGRICWAVTGTHCNGEKQGTYAQKVLLCSDCDFRRKVKDEEGMTFRFIYFKS